MGGENLQGHTLRLETCVQILSASSEIRTRDRQRYRRLRAPQYSTSHQSSFSTPSVKSIKNRQ